MTRRFARGSPTQSRGSEAEAAAERYLAARGYRVLDRNHLCRGGEVDLIVEKGELVCFVEVRSRADVRFGSAAATVTVAKQRKVVRAAKDWLWRRRIDARPVRFDVVAITGRAIEHLPGAFDAGE